MSNRIILQSPPILEIKGLSITFPSAEGGRRIVDNLNFSLHKGQITALIGETGSGKTITGLALMGLLKAKVDISLSNADLLNGKDIAMIFQDPLASFSPIKTIKHHFDDVIAVSKKHNLLDYHSRINDLFADLGLNDQERFMQSYPHQVSGGELQRISIALTLVQNPSILIADEPAASLDFDRKKALFDLLAKLCLKYDLAVLLITHDLQSVIHIASDILVLFEGEIVENGKTNVILSTPQHDYTKTLLNSMLLDDIDSNKAYDFTNKKGQHESSKEALSLELEDVSVTYNLFNGALQKRGIVNALNDISLQLFKGECMGVFGNSGSGKSTLLSAIVQLVDYQGGVFVEGKNVKELNDVDSLNFKRSVQFIFQNPNASLNPRFTVEDTLIFELKMLHPRKNDNFYHQKTIQLLNDVSLGVDVLKQFPHELSGGQKQRVCIARALAFDPTILLCDEVVAALDSTVQLNILKLLNKLKEQFKLALIFVSHDLAAIQFVSDRIIQLEAGKMV